MPEKINSKALSWLPVNQIEESALEQIRNLSGLPFIWKHIAVMPDCHYGMGATIGSVIPTDGTVVPAAVGVDLHCGMIAVRTSLRRTKLETINLGDIREAIGPFEAAWAVDRFRQRAAAGTRVERVQKLKP